MPETPGPKALRNIEPAFPGAPIVGTPDECLRAIERYRQETRFTHLIMGMHLPGLAPAKIMRSLELFAREVMPRFRPSV